MAFFQCQLFKECTEYIHAVGIDEQQQQESHAHHLGIIHKLLGELAASHHLNQQEQDVTTVKRGDRQEVHKRQSHRQECRNIPKIIPAPMLGKHVADSSETAYTLSALFAEDIFELLDIVDQHIGAVGHPLGTDSSRLYSTTVGL